MDRQYYFSEEGFDEESKSNPLFPKKRKNSDGSGALKFCDNPYSDNYDNVYEPTQINLKQVLTKNSIEQNFQVHKISQNQTQENEENKDLQQDQNYQNQYQTTCDNSNDQSQKKSNDFLGQFEQNKKNQTQVQREPIIDFRRDQSKHVQKKQKKNQTQVQTEPTKYFPGQSKNIYKNLGRPYKEFAQQVIEENSIEIDKVWGDFFKSKNQEFTKCDLTKLLQTDLGRSLGLQFFGNFKWVKQIVLENKSDIEIYFPFNMYKRRKLDND